MRFFLVVMFMLLLPLQAVHMLATPSRVYDTEQKMYVLSEHCDQKAQQSSHPDDSYTKVDDCCHHHCHAPSLAMLSSAPLLHIPVFSLKTSGIDPSHFQSFLHSRIERPKWA